MEKKLILVDLDLTLLHSDGTLSPRSAETLRRCQQKGMLVAFCTSRGTTRIKEFLELVTPDILICNAGACIYYRNELVHFETFSLEETHALFDRVYEVCGPDAEITVDTLDDFFWNRRENKTSQYMPESKYDDCRNFPFPAMKFCVQMTDEAKAAAITQVCSNCSAVLFSDVPWYKFSPKSCTKENGMMFLEEYLDIPLSAMLSFGDDYADIGMLRTAGTGVAMGNAIPEVKLAADEVTLSCDEDGVAVYLEKHFL